MERSAWRARYELALRATPPQVQSVAPVSEAGWRVSPLLCAPAPLLLHLQGAEDDRSAAERDGTVVEAMRLSARRTPGNPPSWTWPWTPPMLLLAGYPSHVASISVRATCSDLLALLEEHGFHACETTHRLALKLDAVAR